MFKVDWMSAWAFCKDNDMILATLVDPDEQANFLKLCNKNMDQFANFYYEAHIGGFRPNKTNSLTDWYWFESGQKINFKIDWSDGEPNDDQQTEYCMSIYGGGFQSMTGITTFNDCHCYNMYSSFICQDSQPQ